MPIFAIYILSSWSDFWHGGDCHRACIVLKDFTAYLGAWIKSRISCSAISLIKFTKGIAILSPSLITINSASVVLSATSVCIFDAQVIGHPAYITPYPVLDLAVILSTCTVSALQLPQKSASHHSAMFCPFLILKIIPSSLVAIKFLFSKLLACVTPLGHLRILQIDGLHMLYPAWSTFQENLVVLWPECITTLCAAPCLLCPCVGFYWSLQEFSWLDTVCTFLWYWPSVLLSLCWDTRPPILHPWFWNPSLFILLLSLTLPLPFLLIYSQLCILPVGCFSCNTGMDLPLIVGNLALLIPCANVHFILDLPVSIHIYVLTTLEHVSYCFFHLIDWNPWVTSYIYLVPPLPVGMPTQG